MTRSERNTGRADGLIIGSGGPFYIAINRPAFYLIAGIFVSMAPVIIFLIRDASTPVLLVVSAGVSMERGTLAHIWVERVRGQTGAWPWLVHLGVSLVAFSAIWVLVLLS